MTDVFAALQAELQERHPSIRFDHPDRKGAAMDAWEIYVNVPVPNKNVRVLGLVLRHVGTLKLYPDHFALLPGDLARGVGGVPTRRVFELADPEKLDDLLSIISRCATSAV